ncbi:bifunctional DNA-formamidopyrimidine glycosylase/DNA-(apurinic or apyrimidinic site) lyase [Lysinibacter sp. HNR]|uniref:bifunctional DNA-formamidopyrimidine glycosylase/DNA-(apurinic or apyrimidinic site) lyase n=1 Tax=Lysinibacter sp. HNR TaxID=3031408 RepID=UPI002435A08D|nr:bifunctional DNA-formamidopyrimidine glycosylase/DNA-(apurinic or apyrimidinic site) lyase [Lysinibacter sp. HNR]WGD38404.1 bifunctional DNA-formamidopyrimidine glycosylase/DNA-(apurinic or apyrimidinic site) lyase [Lysinibacter sp. HNR]
MPELPEVEVVRLGLEPAVTNATAQAVEVFESRSLRRHDSNTGSFEHLLTGKKFRAAVRRGKFMWLPLDGERALVIHLGMSGQVLLRTSGQPVEKLLRVRTQLEHPIHGELNMDFVDQRIFGSMAIDRMQPTPDGLPGGAGSAEPMIPQQVSHIARDPIDPAFDDEYFVFRLRQRRTGIKRALLDQQLVSGIGNIYADEALWASRTHGEHPTEEVSVRRARAILAAVRVVLAKALAEGGTSFDTQYVNVNGQAGYFAHSLNAYGRTGKPCSRCDTPIQRIVIGGRSSHFCPRCQRRR